MQTLDLRGHPMPALGFGTFELEGDTCEQAVRDALDLGYRHLDTAAIYGNEERVGKAIRDSGVDRDELFVTTKVWHEDLAPDDLHGATEACLKRLGLDHVDLLLVHWPNEDDASLEATLDALTEEQTREHTRRIGVSNFTPSLFERAVRQAPIANLQIEFHPFLSQDALLERCRAHDVTLSAYSPLARSRVMDDPLLQRIADVHDVTPAAVALRWLLQQDGPVAVLPRSSRRDHIEQNMRCLDLELDDEEMDAIAGLDRAERLIDPSFAPDWAPRSTRPQPGA